MFKYSKKSKDLLNGVDPQLKTLMNEVLKQSKLDIGITYGIRTAEEQRYIFDSGASRCDGVIKTSKHQLGLAVDFVVYYKGKLTYNIKYYYYIVGLIEVISKQLNIKARSGIWWSFEDGGHVELI